MKSSDEVGAYKWAQGYVAWLKPRQKELMSKNGGHWYRKEMIQEQLGIRMTDHGYDVGLIPASHLRALAVTEKAAFDLMVQIVDKTTELGEPMPIGWDDLSAAIKNGSVQRPKGRGPTGEKNGVRDLIFRAMVATLTNKYGLQIGRNDEASTSSRNRPASACEVIADVFDEAGLGKICDRTIEKAVRRCEDFDLFEGIDA